MKGRGFSTNRGQTTPAKKTVLQQIPRQPPSAVLAKISITAGIPTKDQRRSAVIMQILPDAAQIDADRNADSPQVFLRTDPRQHQQLRRPERSGRDQDLAAAPQGASLTPAYVLYSHRPLMIEQDPVHLRSSHDAQPGIRPDFTQECISRAAATPTVGGKLRVADATGRSYVEVRGEW